MKMKKEIKKYYEATKFHFDGKEEFIPDYEWPITWTKVFYKTYPRFPTVDLELNTTKNKNVTSLLKDRKTSREFSKNPISLSTLSNILFYSAGIKLEFREDLDHARRMYPSAGARYPVELYITINNVSDLEKGLYHYNVRDNNLEQLLKKDLRRDMQEILNSDMGTAPILFSLTGVLGRTEVKYGNNAYRFALLEAGHIGQNISLLAEQANLGSCAIGGFDNNKIARLIDLVEDEVPLYIFAIGNKSK